MKKQDILKEKEAMANAIVRVVLCAIGLCVLMAVMFSLFKNNVPDKLAEFEKKGNMEHTSWFLKYGACLPPVIILVGVLTACYPKSSYVPVKTQRDKAIVIAIVAVFTYAVLYTSAKGDSATFNDCVGWFFAQVIPLLIVFSYHLIRASTEKKELLENEN